MDDNSKLQEAEKLPIESVPALKSLSECLTEEQRLQVRLTPKEIQRLTKEIQEKVYWGPAAALPMVCAGPKCPIAATCSLQMIGKAPVGSKCPVELVLINKWKDDYLEDLGASWENKIERQAIMDLVETEIFRHRANGIVAKEGFVMENVIGYDQDTKQEITNKIKHIALDVSDQLGRRQERLLKSLIATREMKEKLGKSKSDRTTKEADLLDKVRKVLARDKGVARDAEIVDRGGEKVTPSDKDHQETPKDSGTGTGAG